MTDALARIRPIRTFERMAWPQARLLMAAMAAAKLAKVAVMVGTTGAKEAAISEAVMAVVAMGASTA